MPTCSGKEYSTTVVKMTLPLNTKDNVPVGTLSFVLSGRVIFCILVSPSNFKYDYSSRHRMDLFIKTHHPSILMVTEAWLFLLQVIIDVRFSHKVADNSEIYLPRRIAIV